MGKGLCRPELTTHEEQTWGANAHKDSGARGLKALPGELLLISNYGL